MRAWLPVPTTTQGRLVQSALRLFGTRAFESVGVGELAADAGVTTGAIYHHFGSKAGLWHLVHDDVRQRVLDRMEGAAAVHPIASVRDAAPMVLTAYDYVVRSGYAALFGAAGPHGDEPEPDRIEQLVDRLVGEGGAPVGFLVVAAWRAALRRWLDGDGAARASLERFLAGG